MVTVPAEFPGTSLSCTSNLPYTYRFFDWKPEPDDWSSESVRSRPLSRTLARPSPQVMSTSREKLVADAAALAEAESNASKRKRSVLLQEAKEAMPSSEQACDYEQSTCAYA